MKVRLVALAALIAVTSTEVSAQVLNLTGQFRCVQGCRDGLVGQLAFITQAGWNLNLVNEAGEPSRGWVDRPGHIWAPNWNEGAIYSADGMIIQFDRGTVWQRDLGEPAPAVTVPRGHALPSRNQRAVAAPIENAPVAVNAFDGSWSVVILTQSGGCDPSYRYGLRISNGNILSDGEAVNLQGRVWPNGAVRVSVSAGGQHAEGEGRMSRTMGSGTWHGDGSGASCAGVWQAARRG